MKKHRLLLFFFLITSVYSQCPNLNYSFDQSVYCVGDTMRLSVSGNNFDSVLVDLYPAVIDTLPTTSPRGMLSTSGNIGYQSLEIVKNSDGNYYAIVGFFNKLTIYNIGSDPLNPVLISSQDFSLASLGLGGNYIRQTQILKEKNRFVLFIARREGTNNQVSILDFGNSLANVPTINSLNLPCTFQGFSPVYFNGKYHILLACAPNVEVLTFASPSDNAPTTFTIPNVINAPAATYYGASYVRKKCNKADFFYYELNTRNIKKITFTDSLSPTSYQITSYSPTNVPAFNPGFLMQGIENFQDKLIYTSFNLDTRAVVATLDTLNNKVTYDILLSSQHTLRNFYVKKIKGEYIFFYQVSSDSLYYVKFSKSIKKDTAVYSSGTISEQLNQKGDRLVELKICQDTMGCQTFYDSVQTGTNLSGEILQLNVPCAGTSVKLTYLLQDSSALDTFYWDLGDGTVLGQKDTVSHIYSSAQNYQVTLSLTDTIGCVLPTSKTITINKLPLADFSVTLPSCAFQPVVFSNTSTMSPPDSLLLFKWDFGDGTSSTEKEPTHQYSRAGNYDVMLIAYSSQLCPDTIVKQISVPGISLTRDSACVNQPINLSYSTFYPMGNVTNAFWEIDGQTYSANPLQHIFTTTGVHNIKVIVNTDNGCQDTLQMPVFITSPPPIDFQIQSSGCINEIITTTYTGVPSEAPIGSVFWDFDTTIVADNQTGSSASYAYTSPGTYFPKISVKDVFGCSNDSLFSLQVSDKPQANFSLAPTLCQKPLFLVAQNNGSDSLLYKWLFPDGTFSSLKEPFFYPDTGTQTITLIVKTSTGCPDTTSRSTTVFPSPQASFYTLPQDSGHIPLTINLVNTTDTSSASLTFQWFQNNVFLSSSYDTLFSADSSQTLTFRLIATNSYGCSDTAMQNFLALPPVPEFMDLELQEIIITKDSLNQAQPELVLRNNGNTVVTHWKNRFAFTHFPEMSLLTQDSLMPSETYRIPLPVHWDYEKFYANRYVCVETFLPNGKQDQVPGNNKKCLPLSFEEPFIRFYPNPASEEIFLEFIVSGETRTDLQILTSLGQILKEEIHLLSEGINKIPLNIEKIPQGIYVLKIRINGKTYYEKLIKK